MFFFFATFWTSEAKASASEEEVQQWVRAARVGNARAARRLYDVHVAKVFRAVRGLCHSDGEAEDVTQDTFIDALGNLNRYAPIEGKTFLLWLMTLAMNRARKLRRGTQRETPTDDAMLHAALEEGPRRLDEESLVRRRTLLKLLSTLPERDRRIVSLYYGAELSANEVAEAVGVRATHVRKICERQTSNLRQMMTGAAA